MACTLLRLASFTQRHYPGRPHVVVYKSASSCTSFSLQPLTSPISQSPWCPAGVLASLAEARVI